jgi:diguanylate cyclase (GGDEF)-like protein
LRQQAEEIRQCAEQMELRGADDAPIENVTLSLGIATWQPSDDATISRLIAKADLALYRAKADGRNRSVAFTRELHGPDH